MGKKATLLIFAVVALVGCATVKDIGQYLRRTDSTNGNNTTSGKSTTYSPNKPFVNTLGMKFVPGTGKELAFCIWKTRVKDYASYASANVGVDTEWRNPRIPQADYPVAGVSWEDAQAFCAWLTKKEISEGRIRVGQRYRLPTDAEWSAAAGLSNEKGKSPKENSMGIKVYPWGKEWPPPKEIGNYSHVLKVDKFNNASPVASFKASEYGLYDMSGNVWEWCEDWYDPEVKKTRVLRGASWATDTPNVLRGPFNSIMHPIFTAPVSAVYGRNRNLTLSLPPGVQVCAPPVGVG